MKARMVVLLVSVLAGEGACGVMLGTSSGPSPECGVGTCVSGLDCAAFACQCKDGETRASAACIASLRCCATERDTCTGECQQYGGWVGGGGAGEGGTATVGGACSGSALVCGCGLDGGCDLLLGCTSGSWSLLRACNYGGCLDRGDSVACGTTALFTPYARAGAACSGSDSYDACTPDGASTLACVGKVWTLSDDCVAQGLECGTINAGSQQCPGSTFCVACR